MTRPRLIRGLACVITICGIGAMLLLRTETTPNHRARSSAREQAAYVGTNQCAECHENELLAWQGSHHGLSMQPANAKTVLGDFNNTQYRYNGVTTTFTSGNGRFFINTDGTDGNLADYEVRYTFGVAPLQQYLVELSGGRLQAISIAWDGRAPTAGGQRWFHLYPNEGIDHADELHWTRLSQNWNHMCAECHSTNLIKNYDVSSNRFDTRWSEINVACESCHGPASRHIAWARRLPRDDSDDHKGLAILLHERKGVAWTLKASAETATRTAPRTTTMEMDMCGRCHSRRTMLREDYRHGQPLMDTHLPALLTPPLYYPDGQIKAEVFEYASFLQSKMFRQGVTCSDCHEPHSLRLRAPGNQTCSQCHRADAFDTEKHHFHPPQSKGALCVECHMPATNFMVVDARHDHSIRIPRPDLSTKLGTPNACNNCHGQRSPAWATARMNEWYGKEWQSVDHFGETIHAAWQGRPVGQALLSIATSLDTPDIARASAVALLPSQMEPAMGAALPRLLNDSSPLVRRAALTALETALPAERWRLAEAHLSDPVLAVRLEAARVLSAAPQETLTPQRQYSLDKGVREYIDAALANAEDPQSHVNLGLLYDGLREFGKAEQSYRQALTLEPAYAIAYVNLADSYRQQHLDAKVEATLLAARAALGENAVVEHAIGLHYVRSGNMPQALSALANAARLEPSSARYAYVFAVALHADGESSRAIKTLQAAHARHPYDRDLLIGLIQYNKAAGNLRAATAYAGKLLEVEPRYGSLEKIMR